MVINQYVGISIIKNNLQSSFKLPSTYFIYTAKAVATLLAIKFINKNLNQKNIILSDSLSSVISVKNKFNPSDMAIQIQNRLEEAKKIIQRHLSLMDTQEQTAMKRQISKQNLLSIQLTYNSFNISTYTDVRKQIKHNTTAIWQNVWGIQMNKLNQIKHTIKRREKNSNISKTNEKKTKSSQNRTHKND